MRDGIFTIVGVASSDGAIGAELNLYASENTASVAKRTGTDTFVRSDADFHGTANVVWAEGCVPPYPYWTICPATAAQVDVASSVEIDHRLFGNFGVGSPLSAHAWQGPNGAGGQTRGGGVFGFANAGPGSYRFVVDASLGLPMYAIGITAWGADVQLPA